MQIIDLRINHLLNPLGFTLDKARASWKVENARGTSQKEARLEVAMDAYFAQPLYDSGWCDGLDSLGTEIPILLSEQTRYYWHVYIKTDAGEEACSDAAWFETGKEKMTGSFITAKQPEAGVSLRYEKHFELQSLPVCARLYACGLGFYEAYLNENKVGNEYLCPGLNAYDQWIQVQTFDVLKDLRCGDNTIHALTGDGLYAGRFGFEGGKKHIYGEHQCFACDLVLTYENGRQEVVSTQKDWAISTSIIRFSDLYDGEIIDEQNKDLQTLETALEEIDREKLMPRLSLPIIEKETIKPVALIHTPAGETVLDMGQNMVGWLTFINRAPKGAKLVIQHGEILQDGNFYNKNLRVAKQEFVYVSDGTVKEVRPHFTFYGFRYAKLIGWEHIDINDFTGRVLYSDMTRTGWIETSDSKVNRLFENVIWGQKGNFVDVPTDCPQRDERMGWTGDAQLYCATAAYNMDTYAFMKKYCHDMKLEQRKLSGMTPMVVPMAGLEGGGACAWADAATIIPWTVYSQTGDKGILEEAYEGMKSWADYIYQQDIASGGSFLWTTGFHFGDWLAMDGENPHFPTGGTEIPYISSCYYLISTEIVGMAARTLGLDEAEIYEERTEKIRSAIYREYFTPTGRLALSNQTAYALALHCHIAPKEQQARVAADFNNKLEKDGGYLKTGFVGTPLLCRMLSDYGYNKMAYKLLLNENMPSWLHCVNLGATTIWEKWDSVLPDGHMNPEGMNSLNHYAYGSIAEWMYRNMGGIRETSVGFRTVRIVPQPDERMEWAKIRYDSAAGCIQSNWEYTSSGIVYHIQLPFNVTGDIEIAVEANQKVTVNGQEAAYCGATWSKTPTGHICSIPAKSGSYHIEVNERK